MAEHERLMLELLPLVQRELSGLEGSSNLGVSQVSEAWTSLTGNQRAGTTDEVVRAIAEKIRDHERFMLELLPFVQAELSRFEWSRELGVGEVSQAWASVTAEKKARNNFFEVVREIAQKITRDHERFMV